MGAGSGDAKVLWMIVWLLALIFAGFPVAFFCSWLYIILVPFTVCIEDCSVRNKITLVSLFKVYSPNTSEKYLKM